MHIFSRYKPSESWAVNKRWLAGRGSGENTEPTLRTVFQQWTRSRKLAWINKTAISLTILFTDTKQCTVRLKLFPNLWLTSWLISICNKSLILSCRLSSWHMESTYSFPFYPSPTILLFFTLKSGLYWEDIKCQSPHKIQKTEVKWSHKIMLYVCLQTWTIWLGNQQMLTKNNCVSLYKLSGISLYIIIYITNKKIYVQRIKG